MEYNQISGDVQAAWCEYYNICFSLGKTPASMVDFVAGFNAARSIYDHSEPTQVGESTADCF